MEFFCRFLAFIERYKYFILAAVYCLAFTIAFYWSHQSMSGSIGLIVIVSALIGFAAAATSYLTIMAMSWFCEYLSKKRDEKSAKKAVCTKKATVQRLRKSLNVYQNVDELSDEEIRERFNDYRKKHKK